jgi:Predicted transcriptional regulators
MEMMCMNQSGSLSIKDASLVTGLTEDTIRYYEKIKLLPAAMRRDNGHRVYHSGDIDRMKLIFCMKKTDMALDEMKPFLKLAQGGNLKDYPELLAKIQLHKEKIKDQLQYLNWILKFIDENMENAFHDRQNCSE